MLSKSLWSLSFVSCLGACAHTAPPPAALADGELAYARAGNSADTLAVELRDLAAGYCHSHHQVVTVDGRDDAPGDHEIEVTLKFHCRPAGQPAPPVAPEEDEGPAEGIGPWVR